MYWFIAFLSYCQVHPSAPHLWYWTHSMGTSLLHQLAWYQAMPIRGMWKGTAGGRSFSSWLWYVFIFLAPAVLGQPVGHAVAFTCSRAQWQSPISFLARFTSAPSEFSSTPLLASYKLCWKPGRCFSACQPFSLAPQCTSPPLRRPQPHTPQRDPNPWRVWYYNMSLTWELWLSPRIGASPYICYFCVL